MLNETHLSKQPKESRELLEDYIDALDHAHYKEEQCAYYQGIVDSIQIFEGLGIIPKSAEVKKILKKLCR